VPAFPVFVPLDQLVYFREGKVFVDLAHSSSSLEQSIDVHLHDNGLFQSLMGWIEEILDFLRNGPAGGKMDINAYLQQPSSGESYSGASVSGLRAT
jgi:hypothetical protein